MTEDLKDINLGGCSADKLLHIGKKEKDIIKIYDRSTNHELFIIKQN